MEWITEVYIEKVSKNRGKQDAVPTLQYYEDNGVLSFNSKVNEIFNVPCKVSLGTDGQKVILKPDKHGVLTLKKYGKSANIYITNARTVANFLEEKGIKLRRMEGYYDRDGGYIVFQ